MARPGKKKVDVTTTAMDPALVFEADVCRSCKFWSSFEDQVRDAGECRGQVPCHPAGAVTARGRVCSYPVTLGSTPRCPLYQAR